MRCASIGWRTRQYGVWDGGLGVDVFDGDAEEGGEVEGLCGGDDDAVKVVDADLDAFDV